MLHSLCRTTHQNFSPNSSQFITPCLVTALVTEISKFHLRVLLGLGVPKDLGFAIWSTKFEVSGGLHRMFSSLEGPQKPLSEKIRAPIKIKSG